MKHVFIINSHTTFLSAYGAINYEKIDEKDVILICIRNYKNKIIKYSCQQYDLSDLSEETFKDFLHNYSARKMVFRKVDEFVNKYINGEFKLYAPHYALPLAQVLYSNKWCKEGSYIQEGAYTYKNLFLSNLSFLQKMRYFYAFYLYKRTMRIRGGGQWFIEGHLSKQKDIHSYAINNSFFKYLPSINHIVKWPSIDMELDFEDDSRIFIFDGFVKNCMMEKEYYMNICSKLIKEYHMKFNYIKFHPGQPEEERNIILSFFENEGLAYRIMDNDIPMELIISSKKNLNFAGFSSSVLYYAIDYGHNVVHREDWQMESPLYSKFLENSGITTLSK